MPQRTDVYRRIKKAKKSKPKVGKLYVDTNWKFGDSVSIGKTIELNADKLQLSGKELILPEDVEIYWGKKTITKDHATNMKRKFSWVLALVIFFSVSSFLLHLYNIFLK